MDQQGQPSSSNDGCPCRIAAWRPAPTGSASRSPSSADLKRDAVVGWGLRLRPSRTASASRVAAPRSLPRRSQPVPPPAHAGSDAWPGERV